MRLEQLQYIVEVANQRSISRAAKNLYISQPSLSKAIAQLEAELGFPIFVRLQQGILPTTIGEQVIAKARLILDELAELRQLSPNADPPAKATLKVALPLLLCNDLLNHTLHILHERYPALNILPYQSDNNDVIASLSDGSLDLGIISYGFLEKDQLESQFKTHPLFSQVLSREDFYLVVNPRSAWAARETVTYHELVGVPIATFSDMLKYNNTFAVDGTAYLTNANLYLPSKESLLNTLLDDSSVVTIFPRIGARTEALVRSGALTAVPIVEFPNTQFITLLLNAEQAIPPYTQAFITIFTEQYNASLL